MLSYPQRGLWGPTQLPYPLLPTCPMILAGIGLLENASACASLPHVHLQLALKFSSFHSKDFWSCRERW